MNTDELVALPLDERLRAMEALWDSICHDTGHALASPGWHAAVLDERARQLDAVAEPLSDWSDAKRRLREATQDR